MCEAGYSKALYKRCCCYVTAIVTWWQRLSLGIYAYKVGMRTYLKKDLIWWSCLTMSETTGPSRSVLSVQTHSSTTGSHVEVLQILYYLELMEIEPGTFCIQSKCCTTEPHSPFLSLSLKLSISTFKRNVIWVWMQTGHKDTDLAPFFAKLTGFVFLKDLDWPVWNYLILISQYYKVRQTERWWTVQGHPVSFKCEYRSLDARILNDPQNSPTSNQVQCLEINWILLGGGSQIAYGKERWERSG